MGTNSSFIRRVNNRICMRDPGETFEIIDNNGLILGSKYYLPEEILALILSYLPPNHLVFSSRLVCKAWCNIIDNQVWRLKLAYLGLPIVKLHSLPWDSLYWLIHKSPLSRNLIKNGYAEESLKHWRITSNGGDGWLVEKPPHGCEDFPEGSLDLVGCSSSFTTSFHMCTAEQVIDLAAEGASPAFMDTIQPVITVSEWCSGRFDCRAYYQLEVELLDEEQRSIDRCSIKRNVGGADGSAWEKVSHEFAQYQREVRYIRFRHYGQDRQFWKGHYGSKMTGACVVLSLRDSATSLTP